MKSTLLEIALAGLIVAGVNVPGATAQPCADLALEVGAEPGIRRETVQTATALVVRVYCAFGVTLHVTDGSASPKDAPFPSRRIMIKRSATKDLAPFGQRRVLGISLRSGDTPGRIAYLFYDAVADAGRRYDVPLGSLMGYAMAHELGHLLLPANAHSEFGVMRADWERSGLTQIRYGTLAMDGREAALICQYLDSLRESR